jgi:hypothetical protein
MKHKIKVDGSSSIASLEYDFVKEDLIVEFLAGSKYRYRGVDSETARELFEAPSKGTYFAAHVKDHFDTEKIGAVLNKPAPYKFPWQPTKPAAKAAPAKAAPAKAAPAPKANPAPKAKPRPVMSMWPFPTGVKKS